MRVCSFCGNTEAEVEVIIAGPSGLFICETCVELCWEIVKDRKGARLIKEIEQEKFNELWGTD